MVRAIKSIPGNLVLFLMALAGMVAIIVLYYGGTVKFATAFFIHVGISASHLVAQFFLISLTPDRRVSTAGGTKR